MAILITGIAGFIGVNLTRTFLEQGKLVIGIDNFSRGTHANISQFEASPLFVFINIDLTDYPTLLTAVQSFETREKITEVWHLAANSDIPAGVSDAGVDLRDTFMSTYSVLQVMKVCGIPLLAFSSSSAIYGDHNDRPLTENTGPLLPISNYGAMKLASEAIISAAAESYLQQALIFRFPNVIGVPATHGVILDFVRKIQSDSNRLPVLGDGSQQKSYLHVEDLVSAMLFIRINSKDRIGVYNIGPEDDGVSVRIIAEEVVRQISPTAKIEYGHENRGWVGDVPRFIYSVEKLAHLGWRPFSTSFDAVRKAVTQIVKQEFSSDSI